MSVTSDLTDSETRNFSAVLRDRGGPYVCETSGLPHFLDCPFTDGGEVLSLTTRRQHLTPRKIRGPHFC
jgi:hypothetical protein